MIVARPISCIARDVGIPARLLSSCSSFEKALHSGPVSSILSVIKNQQFPYTISPHELSVTIGHLPHLGHLSVKSEMSLTNIAHHKVPKHNNTTIYSLFLYICISTKVF